MVTGLSEDQIGGISASAVLVLVALYVAVVVFAVYVYVRIIRKAGYSGWWVLTLFVPVLNVVMFVVFAFAEWPVQQRARAAEEHVRAIQGGYGQLPPGGYGQPGGYGPPGGYGQLPPSY